MELKGSWRCNTRIPNELIVVFSRYVYNSDVNQKSRHIKLSYNSKNFIETLFVRFKIQLCAKGYHGELTNMSYQEYC